MFVVVLRNVLCACALVLTRSCSWCCGCCCGRSAGGLRQEIADEVMAAAAQLQQTHADDVPGLTAPAAIVACSALTGGWWWW